MSPEELASIKVPVTLSYHQLRASRSALHALIGKLKREKEKKPFTPEPGHINLTEAKINTAQEAFDTLDAALAEALDKKGVPRMQPTVLS